MKAFKITAAVFFMSVSSLSWQRVAQIASMAK